MVFAAQHQSCSSNLASEVAVDDDVAEQRPQRRCRRLPRKLEAGILRCYRHRSHLHNLPCCKSLFVRKLSSECGHWDMDRQLWTTEMNKLESGVFSRSPVQWHSQMSDKRLCQRLDKMLLLPKWYSERSRRSVRLEHSR